MTVSPPSPKARSATLAGQTIEVRWSAVVAAARAGSRPRGDAGTAHERREFVITLQPVDEGHALLEAWVEAPSGLRNTVPRQPVGYAFQTDGPHLHVDAFLDGRRVLAISLTQNAGGERGGGLLYAQSILLGQAGFAPGAYDPPNARLVAQEADAASA